MLTLNLLKILGIIIIVVLVIVLIIKFYINYLDKQIYYKGKHIDNFDGKFFIPLNTTNKDLLDTPPMNKTTRRNLLRKVLFHYGYKPAGDDMLAVRYSIPKERIYGDKIDVYVINHSSVLIQTNGVNIITDPIYSKIAGPLNLIGSKRLHPPAIDFKNLPHIDVILLSHNHYDHFDIPTIKKLIKHFNPVIITPLGNDYLINKINKHIKTYALNWTESIQYKNITFSAQKAYHWSARTPWDRNKALWASFVITTSTKNIYFAGDTAFGDGSIFKEIGDNYKVIDLALLPIGAYQPQPLRFAHTNPHEAAKIFKLINAKHAIAIHSGTFTLSQETYKEAADDLTIAKKELGIQQNNFILPVAGQLYKY